MHKKFHQKSLFLALIYWASVNLCAAQEYQPPYMVMPSKVEAVNAALDSFEGTSFDGYAPDNTYDMPEGYRPASVPDPTGSSADRSGAPQDPSDPDEKKIKLSGELYSSVGIYGNGDFVFTRSNGNYTERDFRTLSFDQLNRGQNTFNPGLFTRLKTVVDASLIKSVSMHLNIAIDPWSYVGKSKEVTLTDSFGDEAKFQYYYWSATGFTINRSFRTMRFGDGFAVSEQKVNGNVVPATTVGTIFASQLDIPETKIYYEFQPVREFWFDIKPEDNATIRIFPMGLQDQALTSDDPLGLSNHKIWWAESPWIWDWNPGNLNVGATPIDFTKGAWDPTLAFFTRDSNLERLTALRGVSFKVNPDNDNSIEGVIASPKTLWQDYQDITAVPASVRAKHYLDDKAYIGTIANAHVGFLEGKRDAENYTGGIDGAYVTPWDWLMAKGEWSVSRSLYDQAEPGYATKKNGQAYYMSLSATTNPEDMVRKDYFALQPAAREDNFFKTHLYFSRMDKDFESSLAAYGDTKQDSFWSRHLTFYPNTFRFMPGIETPMSRDDIAVNAFGDGFDYGRNVIGWRADTHLMENRLKGEGEFRSVDNNEGVKKRHIESVARTQWTLQATDKLITKALVVWHSIHKTTAGQDPFLFDHNLDKPLFNDQIRDGQDPSLKTGALGARYELAPWANINGVWEYTNDYAIGTNNFPQGLYSSASYQTFQQDGRTYRELFPFLYSQKFFDQPPYTYHNIFKIGLELIPDETWHIYIDYTRNPRAYSGAIDDNMNHWGIESSWVPNKRVGFFARYTYSRWYDFNTLTNTLAQDGTIHYTGYHNIFCESRFLLTDDSTLSLTYGTGPAYNIKTVYEDPELTYYNNPTLTTTHLIRLTYDKKF